MERDTHSPPLLPGAVRRSARSNSPRSIKQFHAVAADSPVIVIITHFLCRPETTTFSAAPLLRLPCFLHSLRSADTNVRINSPILSLGVNRMCPAALDAQTLASSSRAFARLAVCQTASETNA